MSVELRLLDWNGEELRSKGYKPVRLVDDEWELVFRNQPALKQVRILKRITVFTAEDNYGGMVGGYQVWKDGEPLAPSTFFQQLVQPTEGEMVHVEPTLEGWPMLPIGKPPKPPRRNPIIEALKQLWRHYFG